MTDPQQQQQQPHVNQNEALAKRCLSLFQTAVANDIWPNADIKLDVLDKIMYTLETVNATFLTNAGTASPQTAAQSQGAQQLQQAGSNQQTPQPNYASICTVIEMVMFLVENSSGSRTKIQNIFRAIQRGMTACLLCTNGQVVRAMSQLIQKLMTILPIDCFNSNPNVASATPSLATVNATDRSSLATASLVNSPGLVNNTNLAGADQAQPQSDPIYHLFGQPEGEILKLNNKI